MRILISICLLFTTFSIYAKSYPDISCVGMGASGKPVHVLLDLNSDTINVNGDVFNYDNKSKSKALPTENFINEDGVYVYDSIAFSGKEIKKAKIFQYNAATNKLISYVDLSCHWDS